MHASVVRRAWGPLLVAVAVAIGVAIAIVRARGPHAPEPALREGATRSGVLFAGCATVSGGPICEPPADGHLYLWGPTHAPMRVSTDRGPITPTRTREVESGTGIDVIVPPDARQVRVEVEAGKTWTLTLTRRERAPWVDEIADLREKGELEKARARLIDIIAHVRGPLLAQASGLLARTDLARADYESAAAHFREAIAIDRAEGLVSSEADDTFALTFALGQRMHRYAEARAALEAASDAIAVYPEGQARLPFYAGVLLEDTAELSSALDRFEEARHHAARLGMARLERNAQSSYALELAAIGRREEALMRLRPLAEPSADAMPCDRVDVLDAIGIWTVRSLDEDGGSAANQGTSQINLHEAEEAFTTAAGLYPHGCPDVRQHADVVLGLSEVALRQGDLKKARGRLAEARALLKTRNYFLDVTMRDLEARFALAENHPKAALAAYDAQTQDARGALTLEWEYVNAVGRAQALETLGRSPEALAQYARAETLLDTQSLWIPLGNGRLTFLADRQRSARHLIDLLLRLGRPREAMEAARTSRVRAVAMFERAKRIESLDPDERNRWEESLAAYRRLRDKTDAHAEDEWQLPADRVTRARQEREEQDGELRRALDGAFAVLARSRAPSQSPPPTGAALPAGELVLAYHPVRHGWAAFGATGSTVTAARFDLPEPGGTNAVVAERLFGPFHAPIASANRVHVFPYGALRSIDFHALPFGDGALLDHAIVTYGTDRTTAPPEPPMAAARHALIVADPNDNLAATLDEATRAAAAIRATKGWDALSLVRDEASSVRVREALSNVSWFHYAGHGTFDPKSGLDSALLLANGTRLTVADVLAMPRAPSSVVLSGCETGRATGDAAVDGLGLAQAFVAAGARVVVAPVRPVKDDVAARVASLLYRDFGSDDFDLAAALRDAERTMRAEAPESDWAAFRAVTP